MRFYSIYMSLNNLETKSSFDALAKHILRWSHGSAHDFRLEVSDLMQQIDQATQVT